MGDYCSVCYGDKDRGEPRKLLPIEDGPEGVRVCAKCDGSVLRVVIERADPSVK